MPSVTGLGSVSGGIPAWGLCPSAVEDSSAGRKRSLLRAPDSSSLSPSPQRGTSRQRSAKPCFPSLSKPLSAAVGHKAITPGRSDTYYPYCHRDIETDAQGPSGMEARSAGLSLPSGLP